MKLSTHQVALPPPPDGSEQDRKRRPKLYREPDPQKAYEDVCTQQTKAGLWVATIEDGPWYSDNDIEGRGQTEEAAKADALQKLKSVHDVIVQFLKEQGVAL